MIKEQGRDKTIIYLNQQISCICLNYIKLNINISLKLWLSKIENINKIGVTFFDWTLK